MKKQSALSLNRIAVALADAQSDLHALEAISKLAAHTQAEINAVFIEDADMLRAARLPFAMEVCRLSNVLKPVNTSQIERHLKTHADAARRQIEKSARRSGAKWSFEVVRRSIATAVLDLARGTDVTVFATRTAVEYREPGAAPSTVASDEPVLVVVDRSASARRGAAVAKRLSEVREVPLFALVIAASDAGVERLQSQLIDRDGFDAEHVTSLLQPDFNEIIEAARKLRPSTVVFPTSLIEDSADRIDAVERSLDHCVLFVK